MITTYAKLKSLVFCQVDIAGLSSANLFGFICQANITVVFCKSRSMSSHLPIQNHNPAKRRLKNSPLQSQNLYSAKIRSKSSPVASQGSLRQSQDQWALLREDKITWLSSAKRKSKSSPSAMLTSLGSLLPSQDHRAINCPAETIGHSLLNSPVLRHCIYRLSLLLYLGSLGSSKLKITCFLRLKANSVGCFLPCLENSAQFLLPSQSVIDTQREVNRWMYM